MTVYLPKQQKQQQNCFFVFIHAILAIFISTYWTYKMGEILFLPSKYAPFAVAITTIIPSTLMSILLICFFIDEYFINPIRKCIK